MGDSYRDEKKRRKVRSGYREATVEGEGLRDQENRPWSRLQSINAKYAAAAKPKKVSQLRLL